MEKVTLDKMMGSFYEAAEKFKPELEQQLKLIQE